jgi:hypothetical protein
VRDGPREDVKDLLPRPRPDHVAGQEPRFGRGIGKHRADDGRASQDALLPGRRGVWKQGGDKREDLPSRSMERRVPAPSLFAAAGGDGLRHASYQSSQRRRWRESVAGARVACKAGGRRSLRAGKFLRHVAVGGRRSEGQGPRHPENAAKKQRKNTLKAGLRARRGSCPHERGGRASASYSEARPPRWHAASCGSARSAQLNREDAVVHAACYQPKSRGRSRWEKRSRKARASAHKEVAEFVIRIERRERRSKDIARAGWEELLDVGGFFFDQSNAHAGDSRSA